MTNYVATNTPIANASPGQAITMQASVAAATTADAGTYYVYLVLFNSANTDIFETSFGQQTVTTTPVQYTHTYIIPSNLPYGSYTVAASVRNVAFTWQTVTQSSSAFSVVPQSALSSPNGLVSSSPNQVSFANFTTATNPLNSSSLTNLNPLQDTSPTFNSFYTPALFLKSAAAGFGTPTLAQTRNTFIASFATQAAGLDTPTLTSNNAINSISTYGTTSPVLDTPRPTMTLTSAFNLLAPPSIASSAAGLGQPTLGQTQVISATTLAAGAAGIDVPQFVQFQALTATNLASAAAGIGTPGVGNAYAQLAPQLSFASVDASINQLNAAFIGMPIASSLQAFANTSSLINSLYANAASMTAAVGTGIANKAHLILLSTLTVNEYMRIPDRAHFISAAAMQSSLATFIFDPSETLQAISSIQVSISQAKHATITLAPSVVAAVNEAARLGASASYLNSAALLSDAFIPGASIWQAVALLSPSSTLAIGFTYKVIDPVVLSSVPVIGISEIMRLRTASKVAPVSAIAVFESMLDRAKAALVSASVLTATGAMLENSNALFSSSVTLSSQLAHAPEISSILSPVSSLTSIGILQEQFAAQMNPALQVHVSERQRLSTVLSLLPAISFGITPHALVSPFAILNAQTTLMINERVLPFGTAFYVLRTSMIAVEQQLLISRSLAAMQSQLTSHEGLRMLQPPLVTHASATMTTQEKFVIGPNLKLISNIILSSQTPISLSATQAQLASHTHLHIQYLLEQGIFANLNSSSSMPAVKSSMDVSGLSGMSMGCYMTPDISMSRVIEISAIITARKTRARIVAQGNLVRKYE